MGSAVLSFAADILLGRFILLKKKTFQPFKNLLTLKLAGILTLHAEGWILTHFPGVLKTAAKHMRMPEKCLPQTCRNSSSFLKPEKTFGPKLCSAEFPEMATCKEKTPSPGELTLLIIRFSLLKVGWDRNTESQTQEIMSVKLSCPNKHGRAPSDSTQSALKLQKLELDLQVASTKAPNPDPGIPSKPRHKAHAFCHWHGHINIQRMECCSQSTWVTKCTLIGKVRD